LARVKVRDSSIVSLSRCLVRNEEDFHPSVANVCHIPARSTIHGRRPAKNFAPRKT
jgi:hypothetical protein